jgi:hypothetical protein
MTTLVSVDLSGAIQLLPIGQSIEVKGTTYLWSQLYNMTPANLQALNIYIAPDPAPAPNGKIICGVVYELYNGSIITTPILQDPPTSGVTPAVAIVANDLQQYVYSVHSKFLSVGITVNVGTVTQPINILCDGTPNTQASLALLILYGLQNPTATKTWLDNNNVASVLTGSQLVILGETVGNWIDNTYVTLSDVLQKIEAGTITVIDQITAIQWPTS